MDAFTKTKQQVLDELGVSEQKGLSEEQAVDNAVRFGVNQLSRPPQESLLKKIWNNLTEPMVLMLVIAAIIAFGVNYARGLNGDETEYIECVGIIAAIFLSVAISLIMEGKSAKAFEALNKMKDDIPAKVFRNGKVRLISQKDIVVGDIVCLGTGAKVPADGRLLESVDLRVEEASLTGESEAVKKMPTPFFRSENTAGRPDEHALFGNIRHGRFRHHGRHGCRQRNGIRPDCQRIVLYGKKPDPAAGKTGSSGQRYCDLGRFHGHFGLFNPAGHVHFRRNGKPQ